MKTIRKMMALVIAVVMMVAMGTTVFAADDGSIKVTNATKGQTYEAFLIFTANPSDPDDVTQNITYTATAAQVAVTGFDTYFDKIVDENGNYTISKKSTAQDDDIITWVKTNIDSLKQGAAITGTWTDNDTVTFSNLKYGYYYITSSLGTLVTIDTAGKDISVYDKNETTPTGPDKDITAEDSSINEGQDQTNQELDTNAAAVGSVESFQVDFNATNWVKASADAQTAGSGTQGTKVTEYNFTDTPTGLAIDASTVVVTVNYGTDAAQEVTVNASVDKDTGVLSFTIPWVDENGKHLYATPTDSSELIPVHITYNATVLDAAATATAPNTVEVKYNNTTSLGTSSTTTYTYKFQLEKLDENSAALDGAEFELYYAGTTAGSTTSVGDALTFTLVDGVYHFDPAGTVTHIAPKGDDATALIVGLDDANYVLKEVVVPAGYNKAADTAVAGLSRVDTADASSTKISITNLKGTELPSTGGIGTTLFYVIGAILVLGAGILLVTRRRMNAN